MDDTNKNNSTRRSKRAKNVETTAMDDTDENNGVPKRTTNCEEVNDRPKTQCRWEQWRTEKYDCNEVENQPDIQCRWERWRTKKYDREEVDDRPETQCSWERWRTEKYGCKKESNSWWQEWRNILEYKNWTFEKWSSPGIETDKNWCWHFRAYNSMFLFRCFVWRTVTTMDVECDASDISKWVRHIVRKDVNVSAYQLRAKILSLVFDAKVSSYSVCSINAACTMSYLVNTVRFFTTILEESTCSSNLCPDMMRNLNSTIITVQLTELNRFPCWTAWRLRYLVISGHFRGQLYSVFNWGKSVSLYSNMSTTIFSHFRSLPRQPI